MYVAEPNADPGQHGHAQGLHRCPSSGQRSSSGATIPNARDLRGKDAFCPQDRRAKPPGCAPAGGPRGRQAAMFQTLEVLVNESHLREGVCFQCVAGLLLRVGEQRVGDAGHGRSYGRLVFLGPEVAALFSWSKAQDPMPALKPEADPN